MMSANGLDQSEFLHLALRAMEADRHDEAISLLKRMTGAFPEDANAHYLLGAEHAQIGLYDRALEDFAAALRVQPQLAAARFQLGLLHLTLGQTSEAETVWSPLDELAADDPLRLFKSALVHLIHDELEDCARGLRAGIDRNRGNEALNVDMRRLLADVERRFAVGFADPNGGATAPSTLIPLRSSGMVLKTYDRNGDGGADD
jgi:tetratricopeptide (TPR) repeat protein